MKAIRSFLYKRALQRVMPGASEIYNQPEYEIMLIALPVRRELFQLGSAELRARAVNRVGQLAASTAMQLMRKRVGTSVTPMRSNAPWRREVQVDGDGNVVSSRPTDGGPIQDAADAD